MPWPWKPGRTITSAANKVAPPTGSWFEYMPPLVKLDQSISGS